MEIMRGIILRSMGLLVGITALGFMPASQVGAQSFKVLHRFAQLPYGEPHHTNKDGSHPRSSLVLAGNTLYGTAQYAGNGVGTLFAINTDGSGFRILHSFSAISYVTQDFE